LFNLSENVKVVENYQRNPSAMFVEIIPTTVDDFRRAAVAEFRRLCPCCPCFVIREVKYLLVVEQGVNVRHHLKDISRKLLKTYSYEGVDDFVNEVVGGIELVGEIQQLTQITCMKSPISSISQLLKASLSVEYSSISPSTNIEYPWPPESDCKICTISVSGYYKISFSTSSSSSSSSNSSSSN
jgi:hypothetical protein